MTKRPQNLIIYFIILLFPGISFCQTTLPSSLSKLIKQSGFGKKGISLFVQAVDEETPIVSFQSNKPMNPASVIKLVTTAASFGILGTGYQWSTDVFHTGTINNGSLNGNLYFRGNGDPYLTPERFWRLLNRISIYGVQNINGDVIFDNSYFDVGPINYAAFDDQPFRSYNVGPNALLVGFQATEFHFSVEPASSKRNTVNIIPFPASPKMRIVNKVKIIKGACGSWQKRLKIATKIKKGELIVSFNGRYAKACDKRTLYRRVMEADDHFQHYFLPLWQQLDGSFSGKVKPGKLPERAKIILKERSISLGEAVRLINKFSNNVMTRQVLLSLGAQQNAVPGTTEKGIAAIQTWLVQNNLDDKSLHLVNGSGLSRDTRIKASQLGRLLYFIYKKPYMPEFIASLPVAGYDGTMARRFAKHPLIGHAHIKTGLLDYVQTMAGYVTNLKGRRFVVVLLHNHPRAHTKAAQALQNEVLKWVFNL